MRNLIAWFVDNRVAATVMMLLIIGSGLIAVPSIKKELFPSIRLDVIEIEITYPGADPATVEKAVCLPVEEAVDGLENIKSIETLASSETGTVLVTAAANNATARLEAAIKN
ncbi:MAG: efflux RND transporter permease subunit, partial [Geminicoccaceae bacterium]